MKNLIAIGLIGLFLLSLIVVWKQESVIFLKNGSLTLIIDGDGAIDFDLGD